jgi:sirohydrochlorin cobaltochelatase
MPTIAIVLAAFGVAHVEALPGITNVLARVRREFAGSEVVLAFTSNQIRHKWRQRSLDEAWRAANPLVPPEVMQVRGPLAAIAELQDAGWRDIIVQPMHIYAGEEFADLQSYVQGLNSIRTVKPRWMPFAKLVLGRPALGQPGPQFPYQEDIARAALALSTDAESAARLDAALVLAGHGNPCYPTGVYAELELAMRRLHPGLPVFIGVVDGCLSLDYVMERLDGTSARRVLLKPLMLVAGGHAIHDLGGVGQDSWRSRLQAKGYEVTCDLRGLGENPQWAEIYVEHIRQTVQSAPGLG